MSTKHTPGPWVAIFPERRRFHEGSDITSFDVMSEKTRAQLRAEGRDHYATRYEEVANVEIVSSQFWRDLTDEEAKANARLIAAAPELLEALEWISENGPDDAWELRERARAAVAKATGKQP